MKNNKGQVLVAFVLMVPLILIIMAIFLDLGLIALKKRQVTNTLNDALEYASKNKEQEELEENLNFIIKENLNDVDMLQIELGEEKVKIHIIIKVDGNFKTLLDKDLYEIDLTKEIAYE